MYNFISMYPQENMQEFDMEYAEAVRLVFGRRVEERENFEHITCQMVSSNGHGILTRYKWTRLLGH